MSQDVEEIKARIDGLEVELKKVADDLKEVTASMSDVAETYRDLQGTFRIGGSLQRFALWLTKWGVVGGALWAALRWAVDNLPSVAP